MKPDFLTIDFETYYADDFSLSRRDTTSLSYVYDPRFQIICVAVKKNAEAPVSFSGTVRETRNWLREFDIEKSVVAGHNMAEFDALIMGRLGLKPLRYVCTMQLARLHGVDNDSSLSLGALAEYFGLKRKKGTYVVQAKGKRREDFTPEEMLAYREYCELDTDLCYEIFERMSPNTPAVEWVVMDYTTKCLAHPVLEVDIPLLEDYIVTLGEKKAELIDRADSDAKELGSNEQFAMRLMNLGVTPPMKFSPKQKNEDGTPKLIYAFAKSDAGMAALLDHDNDDVVALAEARLGVKSRIEETRAQRFIDTARLCGGKMPMPLRYGGAHTLRWSGVMKLNVQNLSARKREPVLKRSLKAPADHVVLSADSKQIEVRVNAWVSEQDDLLASLGAGSDVYREFASDSIYYVPIDEITAMQRAVAKSAVLGAGFNMGGPRFKEYVRQNEKIILTDEEAQDVINRFRARYAKIANFWQVCRAVLVGMCSGQDYTFGRGNCLRSSSVDKTITLPSGRKLFYPNLRMVQTERGVGFVYDRRKGRTSFPVFVHPGLLTENCIAGGTDIWTQRGWVPIEQIQLSDHVHDGVEFVSHAGLVAKSVQTCVMVDGVYMTPDHEVLTDEGWTPASADPRPYRPEIRGAYGFAFGILRWKKLLVAHAVRLWRAVLSYSTGFGESDSSGPNSKLRLFDFRRPRGETNYTRDDEASCVRGMAFDERPMQIVDAPCMGSLWRAWRPGVRRLADFFFRVLGGHGRDVPQGAGFRPPRQQRPILTGKLPVGRSSLQLYEQAKHNPAYRRLGGSEGVWNQSVDALLPYRARMASRSVDSPPCNDKPVYDILNAGPRQRFVVRGISGPFVVHNCVQAIARDIVAWQGALVSQKYPLVTLTHDELVALVLAVLKEEAVNFVSDSMSRVPKWASGLIVGCNIGSGINYGDA